MTYFTWISLIALVLVRTSAFTRRGSFSKRPAELRKYITHATIKTLTFSWLWWLLLLLGALKENLQSSFLATVLIALGSGALASVIVIFWLFVRVHGDAMGDAFVGEALSTRRPFTFSASNGFVALGLCCDAMLLVAKMKPSPLKEMAGMLQSTISHWDAPVLAAVMEPWR